MKVFFLATLMSVTAALGATAQDGVRTASITGEKHSVRVTGYGEVTLIPDMAHIYVGIHTQAEHAQEAVASNSADTHKVLDTLIQYGIAAEDIRTINFSIYPRQEYDHNGQPTVLYYVVQNTVWVTMRDLGQVGELLDAVIAAGASTISGLQFDVSERDPAFADALNSAVGAALRKAQILALSAGVTLGEVLSLDTAYGGSYYDNGRDEGGATGGSAASGSHPPPRAR